MRSAGFPASEVLRFAASDTSRAVARLIECEALVEQARATAIAECRQLLDTAPDTAPDHDRKAIRRRLDRLRSGRLPEGNAGELAALRSADERRAAQRQIVDETLGQDSRRIAAGIRELARDARFREALVWQNRAAIGLMLEPLLAAPIGATDSHTRQKEAAVASYAQRYCVKNDTIGFFGPVGWARIGDGDAVVRVDPGEPLIDIRRVHFEYWCMDALAVRLAEDPELRRELAPRRLPTVRIDGTTVHYPIARSTQIAPDYAALLAACDGQTPARAIARALGSDPALGVSEDDVYAMLGELVEQRLVRWTLEIPTAGQHPERHLRRALERLPAGEARARALEALADLEAGRDAVARAAGDPAALDRALAAVDDRFSRLTGLAATRRAGQMYAGRTLIYEETHRNVEVELGARFVERLAPPLALVLISARWYTHAVAAAYRPVFRAVYRELREQTGDARVDYLQYLERILPQFAEQARVAPAVAPIVDQLHARWMELLGVTHEVRRIERAASALRPRAEAAFTAPGPGWPQARYHSPDLMIAAADLPSLVRGDFVSVLNEIHTGVHSYTRPMFLGLHPDPDRLLRARVLDLGRPVVSTVEPRANALRSDHFPPVPDDIDIEATDARSWRAPDRVLPVAQLVVEELDGALVVRTRDGRRTFDIVEVFEAYLQLASETHFTLLPSRGHMPRVTIDDLVVSRESWSFAPAELGFATANGVERFIGARRWAERNALPRFVFVRVPHEPKPYFIDLESPIYVEILAKFVRQASAIAISEMLPAIDQTWLVDAAGRTYTAELRMAMVDPQPWRAGMS